MLAMERGWQIYQNYFVKKWSRSLRRKRSVWSPQLIDEGIFRLGDLRRMTATMVARHTSFPDITAYLDGYAVTGAVLRHLAVPAVILAAQDDPIIPAADIAKLAPSPHLKVVATERGGHMGFMESPFRDSWINGFVMREMGLDAAG
jgi:predicted alpha/beta-fold hydrolase